MKELSGVDIHFQALCNAVENEKMDKIRSILDHNPHLNTANRNGDKISPLDMAFMLGNNQMLEILLSHRSGNGSSLDDVTNTVPDLFPTPEATMSHLTALIGESKKQVDKFGQLVRTADPAGVIAVTSAVPSLPNNLNRDQIRECEKQKTLWTKRLNSLRRMRAGFLSHFSPQAPKDVVTEVLGIDTVKITACVNQEINPKSLVTKFKVQWSLNDKFQPLNGERVVDCAAGNFVGGMRASQGSGDGYQTIIRGLVSNQRYYVRVAFGNLKGYGSFCGALSNPVVPSSWRSLENTLPRFQNQLELSGRILDKVLDSGGAGTNSPINAGSSENISNPLKAKRKGLFQQLLSAAGSPKFHRIAQVIHGFYFHSLDLCFALILLIWFISPNH